MAVHLRKLLSDSDSYACPSFCIDDDNSSDLCPTACVDVCFTICNHSFVPPQSPPLPPTSHQSFAKTHKSALILICLLSVVAIIFVLVFLLALYRRFYSRRFPSLVRSPLQPPESYDEDDGPILDHQVWYIRTVGLQPSVINSITICKFKPQDGLIEGTDCSVCLTEFEEEENLRLLPKCNHAFHLPCIDTWLRSHTNCPLCRASVVAVDSPTELERVGSGQAEEIRFENQENFGRREEEEAEQEEEGDELPGVDDGRKRSSETSNGGQVVRRSVSLDSISLSAFQAPKSSSDQFDSAGENSSNTAQICSKTSEKSLYRESVKRSLSCTSKFLLRTCSTQSKNGVIPK